MFDLSTRYVWYGMWYADYILVKGIFPSIASCLEHVVEFLD